MLLVHLISHSKEYVAVFLCYWFELDVSHEYDINS